MASFEQNKSNKTWSVRFRAIEHGFEKNKRLSGFRTKKEAENAYHQWMLDYKVHNGGLDDGVTKSILFKDLCRMYLDDLKRRVKPTTYTKEEVTIRLHIEPYFGGFQASMIKPIMMQEWVYAQNDCSYASLVHRVTIFRSLFHYGAKMLGLNDESNKITLPKQTEKREMQIWSPEEYLAFEQYLEGESIKMYFRTLFIGGLRKGEAAALTWDDIGTDRIHVCKTWTPNGVTTPKTLESNRYAVMPKDYMDRLKALPHKHGIYVFGLSIYKYAESRFGIILKEHPELKRIRIHDLRHSCASYLLGQGFSIVAVSKRLGHANPNTTLKVYAHLVEKEEEKFAKVFTELGTN